MAEPNNDGDVDVEPFPRPGEPYANLMKYGVVCKHDDDYLCEARFKAIYRAIILEVAKAVG